MQMLPQGLLLELHCWEGAHCDTTLMARMFPTRVLRGEVLKFRSNNAEATAPLQCQPASFFLTFPKPLQAEDRRHRSSGFCCVCMLDTVCPNPSHLWGHGGPVVSDPFTPVQAEDGRHQRRMVQLTAERIHELEQQITDARNAQVPPPPLFPPPSVCLE